MQCLRLLNKNVLDVLDSKTSYKSIGSFKTRREAEEALANYYMNPIDYAGKIETFEQLYEAWAKDYFKKVSPSSVRTVTSTYKYCSAGYNMLTMCNLMFDYAFERRLIYYNPARAFKVTHLIREIEEEKKVKQVFSPKDIKKMWKYVDVTPYTDMVLIGLYTGFRPQELAILEIDNIDLEEGSIIGGMKTSNGKNRKVPIHPDIKPLVEKRYIEATELFCSDRLFNDPRSQTGIRLTYDKYRRKFEFVMADLALSGFSPHCTRHTFATYAKKSGMEPGITKRIMGHSLRSDVTEYYYTHPEFSDFENEIRKLSFE